MLEVLRTENPLLSLQEREICSILRSDIVIVTSDYE